jgi:uncharacterized protein (UPF0218 family)
MPLSEKDAQILKEPFGKLIPDRQVTKNRLVPILKGSKKVIAVGDATTEKLSSLGITPDIAIVDGRERRSKRDVPSNYPAKEMQCTNPAGAISEDAVNVIQQALKAKLPVRVLVDGEEDLLALPAFAMSPVGSTVLYGQPLEGLVVVRTTPAKQRQARELMDRITGSD